MTRNTYRVTRSIGGLLFGICFLLLVSPVKAAEIYFGAQSPTVVVGQLFEVGVFLNTKEETLNALEGEIVIPTDAVALREVRDGGSVVNLWLEKPKASISGDKVAFSGVLPGGYAGPRGYLFSLILEAKKDGPFSVSSLQEHMYRHDGEGTEIAISRSPLAMRIEATTTTPPVLLAPFDPDAPESFVPSVTQFADAFDGKYVLIFTTQDKGSGIARYEVAERRLWPWESSDASALRWKEAVSPYVLEDQDLKSTIFVRAFDYAGNVRSALVQPMKPVPYLKYVGLCILFLILLCILLVTRIFKNTHGGRKTGRKTRA
jgi:hypothetical protein